MARKPTASSMEHALVSAVAKKTQKVKGDSYWVENEGQRIGPYKKGTNASKRLAEENTVYGESGAKSKTPELIYQPKGVTMNPSSQKRISPNAPKGNGPNSRGYDYQTNQAVRKDTPAQRKMQPRGWQGKTTGNNKSVPLSGKNY